MFGTLAFIIGAVIAVAGIAITVLRYRIAAHFSVRAANNQAVRWMFSSTYLAFVGGFAVCLGLAAIILGATR